MQGIYTYIPETNYVPREYSVAAIQLLLFMVFISLVFSVESLVFLHKYFPKYVCNNNNNNNNNNKIIIIIIILICYNIQYDKTPSYSRTKHKLREFKTIMKQSVNDIKYKV